MKLDNEKFLKLLSEYVEKEKEINREFDEAEGIDVNAEDYEPTSDAMQIRLEAFAHYQVTKAEHDKMAKLARESSQDKKSLVAELNEIDLKQKQAHDGALTSLMGIVEFGKQNNLSPIYEGKILTEEQISGNGFVNPDVKAEMTEYIVDVVECIRETENEQEVEDELNNAIGELETIEEEVDTEDELER